MNTEIKLSELNKKKLELQNKIDDLITDFCKNVAPITELNANVKTTFKYTEDGNQHWLYNVSEIKITL